MNKDTYYCIDCKKEQEAVGQTEHEQNNAMHALGWNCYHLRGWKCGECDAKHTPGPWCVVWLYAALRHVDKHCDYDTLGIPDVVKAALLADEVFAPSKDDAPLIAAAPTLLAALESAPLLHKFHGPSGFDKEGFFDAYLAWMDKRRDAIARTEDAQ